MKHGRTGYGGAVALALEARELRLFEREAAVSLREAAQGHSADVKEANAHLVLASLAADEMKEAAETTKRRQDEFLAMLAHELRNPLAPIRSAVALLARLDTTNPSLTLIREVIRRQVEHMARLLDDLLDASRVTSGKVNLQRRAVPVGEFVDHAVEICREIIETRHQQLTLDMPVKPMYVNGDPVRLAQIVGNLLHNAAKYTPEAGAISVSARPVGRTVVIRVSDNGDGIAADALLHIFDLFSQEARSLSRSQGGLGIGLTVVRSMVDMHGGSVEVSSGGIGRGSEFVVTLPSIDHEPEHPVEPVHVASTSTKRILLVDDNVDGGLLLAMLLRASGHEVQVALDGPGAVDAFLTVRPEILLCDIGLPGMSGYEVGSRIIALAGDAMPTMIALTGYDGPEHRARSLAAGFDRHVVKPVDFDALLALIDECSAKA